MPKMNQKAYTHYVVISTCSAAVCAMYPASDGAPKIESGWEYATDAADNIREKNRLHASARAKSRRRLENLPQKIKAKVFTKTRLIREMRLDPEDDGNWLRSLLDGS
jgi:hypothetical protein